MSKSPKSLSRIWRNLFTVAGLLLGTGAAVGSIFSASSAAFSVNTVNPADSWKIGGISLVDDDAGAAMFNVTGMVPGQTVTHCITVTYNGDASSVTPVKLYTTGLGDTDAIAPYLDVTIEEGNGASFADCSGFTSTSTKVNNETLAAITTNHTNFATGVVGFTPSVAANQANLNQSASYRFTVTLNNSVPQTKMGKTASVNFVWEIQTL